MSGTKSKHGEHHAHSKDHHHAPPKHLDEVLEQLADAHVEKLDDAVEAHKKFTEEDNQLHLYNKVFTPAHDKMYEAVVKGLEELGGGEDGHGDATKVHGKEKELKKILGKGLKEYFKVAKPSVTKALEELKLEEHEEYDILAQEYDHDLGVGVLKDPRTGRSIEGLAELATEYAKDKKATIGHIKQALRQNQSPHANYAKQMQIRRHYDHLFKDYNGPQLAGYFKKLIDERGLEIVEPVKFINTQRNAFPLILTALEEGEWGEGGYKQYGLGKKGDKAKFKAEEEAQGHKGGH